MCHVFASALLRGRAVINMGGCFCESACVCTSRMSELCVSVPSVSRRHWKHDSRGMEKGGFAHCCFQSRPAGELMEIRIFVCGAVNRTIIISVQIQMSH